MLKKVKRRYLALEIDSDEIFDSKEFIGTIWSVVSKLYGEYGASQIDLTLINYDDEKKFAVIRTRNAALKMIRTTIASLTEIGNKPAAIHILKVSGTIKALYKKVEKIRTI